MILYPMSSKFFHTTKTPEAFDYGILDISLRMSTDFAVTKRLLRSWPINLPPSYSSCNVYLCNPCPTVPELAMLHDPGRSALHLHVHVFGPSVFSLCWSKAAELVVYASLSLTTLLRKYKGNEDGRPWARVSLVLDWRKRARIEASTRDEE